jgi:hypothetical protein
MFRSSLASALLALLAPAAAAQSTWFVDLAGVAPGTGTAQDPYTSIQYAVAQPTTQSGDTVAIAAGVYFENVDLLGKVLELAGEGAGQTILDGAGAGRVVRFSPGSDGVLRDLTVRNGVALSPGDDHGGGVLIEGGSPELRRLIVRDCLANFGSGIAVLGGAPLVSECSITDNGAAAPVTIAGAGIYADCASAPLVEHSDITLNRFSTQGGGVAGAGTYRFCQIDDNAAERGGGAHARGCALTFEDCSVSRNLAANPQGDLHEGGGVIGPAKLERCVLEGNLANVEGGGALECTLVMCELRDNELDNFLTSTLVARGAGAARSTLFDCTVEGNRVGGGLAGFDFLAGEGAGLYDCVASGTRIVGNLARNGRGGGAHSSQLTNCTLEANEARLGTDANSGLGGGAALSQLTRCVVLDNLAANGAAVWNSSLTHCTLVDNTAAAGAALFDDLGAANVTNSILWSNFPAQIQDVSGLLSVSYTLVDGGWPGVGNLAVDPRFILPQARDLHLNPLSPCIDAGDPAAALDPDASLADIGAFHFDSQYAPPPAIWCTGKPNSEGCVPQMSAVGGTSLSGPDDFALHCTQLVGDRSGFLFWGFAPLNVPFGGGTRCVGVAFRTSLQNSGGGIPPAPCAGELHFDFDLAYGAQFGVGAGSTIYGQWFARDPGNLDGTGISLSNAVEATFLP